ncbi:MAG: competence/damage-inducible protein A, partial [candidate division Zixibacteria bacterium]|nr:competence/damage-inducible protein A [candidate division Zixibacteria bacterium]
MDTEIITIGDELVTGHTVNTNAALIARYVTDLGFSVRYQTSVGDSLESMEEAFRLALNRARLVITTGGLGPTHDDITKKAIVRLFKRNLIFHQEILDDIRARFAKRGVEMPAINQNQALLPQGATLFPNKHGSAVGLCIAEEGRIFISLPGVP